MSAVQRETRMRTATHILEGMPWLMSAIQMETRMRTATHRLEEISWLHVRASNGDQEAHGNSQSGRDAMAACQRFQWGPGAHGNSLSRYWMDCFFVVNLKILHVT